MCVIIGTPSYGLEACCNNVYQYSHMHIVFKIDHLRFGVQRARSCNLFCVLLKKVFHRLSKCCSLVLCEIGQFSLCNLVVRNAICVFSHGPYQVYQEESVQTRTWSMTLGCHRCSCQKNSLPTAPAFVSKSSSIR